MSNNSRLVYSTKTGRIKTGDTPKAEIPQGDGIVRIHRETKGRKGKGVSIIKGLPLGADDLKQVAKTLKQRCGVGGSVKNMDIEIQTDNRDKLKVELEALGYTVRLAGS